MSDPQPNYDAFIGYSHKDADWVRGWLLPPLKDAGISLLRQLLSGDYVQEAPTALLSFAITVENRELRSARAQAGA